MRMRVVTASLLLAAGIAMPAEHPEQDTYVKRTFGKNALIQTGVGAGILEANNSPHEWGRGIAGAGKRVGSVFGKHVIKGAIQTTVAKVRHEQLGYTPSGKKGFGPRVKYALLSTVVTRKTTTGKKTVASGRISGAFGAGFISRLWMPARLHTVSSGISSSGISLGVDAGMNVTREFWPEIRHPRKKK
jgi:hypothetical protein